MKGFALVLLLPAIALAAEVPFVPNGLMHQGRMLGPNDEPVTSKLTMTFSIYAQGVGGTALWTETKEVEFESGFYSVVLGDPATDGPAIPSSVFAGPVFLGVRVGDANEMYPRLQVTAAAFAARADLANRMVGGTIQSATIQDSTLVNPASIRVGSQEVIDATGRYVGPDDQLNAATLGNIAASEYLLRDTADQQYIRRAGDVIDGTLSTTGELRAATLVSTTTVGPPLTVASSVMVPRLNAELLDGRPGSDYVTQGEFTAHNFENLSLNSSFERAGSGGLPLFFEAFGPVDAVGGRALVQRTNIDLPPVFGGWALRVADSDPTRTVAVRQTIIPQGQAAGLAGRKFTAAIHAIHNTGNESRSAICIVDRGDPFAPDASPETVSATCATPAVSASEFQRISVTHTVGENPAGLWVVFGPTPPGVTGEAFRSSGTVFDGLMVVEGSHRPAWSAHLSERLGTSTVVGNVLVDASVTGDKIAATSLSGSHFAEGSIHGDRLTNSSVSASKLQMGAGSGLDADLIDGLDSTAFMRVNPPGGVVETSGSLTVRGSLGVGPSAPAAKLHVSSGNDVQMRLETTGNTNEIQFVRGSSTWRVGTNVANDFRIYANAQAAPPLTITSAGKVGFGGATVDNNFDVQVNGSLKVTGQTDFGCVYRSNTSTSTSGSVSCIDNTKVVSGGCSIAGGAIITSGPDQNRTGWSCAGSSGANTTVSYAVCCRY